MGKIISSSTVYATAYLTEKGRTYLFNKNNVRFDKNGNDLFEIKTFTLGDPDTNYITGQRLESGDVPDITGKSEGVLKSVANYNQTTLAYYTIDVLSFADPLYKTNLIGSSLVINTDIPFTLNTATDIPPPSDIKTPILPNISPDIIKFKQSIQLFTFDESDNNAPITEGYIVSGPTSQGVLPLPTGGGPKVRIPLTTATGDGAPFLRLHRPTNPNGNTLYLTYAISHSKVADGYYDYQTGVPAIYYNKLREWINTNPNTGKPYINSSPTVRARTLKFSAYGNATNKPAEAVTFFIRFNGTFGSQTVTNVLAGGSRTTSTGPALVGPALVGPALVGPAPALS